MEINDIEPGAELSTEGQPPLPSDDPHMPLQETEAATNTVDASGKPDWTTLGGPKMGRRTFVTYTATATVTFLSGLGVGFWAWGRPLAFAPAPTAPAPHASAPVPSALMLPHSYTLPITYGKIGPQLIRAGAFDYESFAQIYATAGTPLTDDQRAVLLEGSDDEVVINESNARFLLNLLWAVGLANNNPVLRTGAILTNSQGKIEGYASTGGWPLATRPIQNLFSGSTLVSLNITQQARMEEAADAIYRPCCNNATSFPDCNHGMAMLGLLEMMAARETSTDVMLEAAKAVNRFWFPEQTSELALYYQAQGAVDFDAIPAREAVGVEHFSANGFAELHNWLVANNKLNAPSQSGSNCGV